MGLISDQDYLRKQQYPVPDNLDARMNIHLRFSRNSYGWFCWVWEHLNLQPGMRVLELGCGTGALWAHNRARLPDDIRLVLSDISPGMASEARRALGGDARFTFLVCDAQAVPLRGRHFDLVIANHMLYHVPDLTCTLGEIERVLSPHGCLAAATNGREHMLELYELIRQFDPGIRQDNDSAMRFGLENGAEQLAMAFPRLEKFIYEDSLWVTDAPALAAYIMSMWGMGTWNNERAESLRSMIAETIKKKGGVFIRKATGLFLAGYSM